MGGRKEAGHLKRNISNSLDTCIHQIKSNQVKSIIPCSGLPHLTEHSTMPSPPAGCLPGTPFFPQGSWGGRGDDTRVRSIICCLYISPLLRLGALCTPLRGFGVRGLLPPLPPSPPPGRDVRKPEHKRLILPSFVCLWES